MAHHPPFPAVLELIPFEDEAADWTLLTTPGFVVSDDPEGLICKEAFGVDGLLYASVLGPTHFAMAATEGVAITRDGCDVDALHPVEGRVVDMDGRDDILVVLVNDLVGDRLYLSDDGGDSLREIFAFSEELAATAVGLAEPSTAVISAYVKSGPQRGDTRLLVVDLVDEAVEYFEDPQGHRFPYIFAASDGQVAWAARGVTRSFMLWGPLEELDRHRVELPVWPLFATFGESGELWISGLDEEWQGAARATPDGLEMDARLTEHNTNCAIPDGGGLWVCSDGFAEAYELWRLDGDDEMEPFYRLAYLEGVRQSCPEDSAVAQICPGVWELLSETIAQRDLPEEEPDEEEPDEENEGPDEEEEEAEDEQEDWIRDSMRTGEDREDASSNEADDDAAGCHQSRGGGGSWFLLVLTGVFFCSIKKDRKTPDSR